MIRRNRRRLLILAGLFLFVAGSLAWLLRWDSEEYAVYDTILRQAYADPKISHYLILKTTVGGWSWGVSPSHARELELSAGIRLNYAIKNLVASRVPSRMRLTYNYATTSEEELQKTYAAGADATPAERQLLQQVRESWGVITFSRAGFDLRRRHAVVYAQLIYCGLCGGGDYFYLERTGGGWRVIGRAGTWIS